MPPKSATVALLLLAASTANLQAAPFTDAEHAGLAYDDQCAEGTCALHALQRHTVRRAADVEVAAEAGQAPHTCASLATCGRYVRWQPCQCDASCSHHRNCCADYKTTCTAQGREQPAADADLLGAKRYDPQQRVLLQPSNGELLTFYMYRAQSNTSYPLENVNAANLAGSLWYIQNEIVSGKWGSTERFGVSMIKRFKVQMRATQPLVDKGMNFGLRVAFDSGMCTNKACTYDWWLYGFNVGCNRLGSYPWPMFETYYPDGVWYSLPGPCPAATWYRENATCDATMPGGRCKGTPTGTGDCTYNYEDAGYVTLDEVYDHAGVSEPTFWADPTSLSANAKKVSSVAQLFELKYPHAPSPQQLKDPECNFDKAAFYKCDICR